MQKEVWIFGCDDGLSFRISGLWVGKFISYFCHWVFGEGWEGDFTAEAQRNAEEEIFWGLFFVELKNTPYDAVSQQWNVEVDEETGFPGTEAEVGE